LSLLATFVFAATAVVLSPPPECQADRAALLKLTPEQFDEDMHGGWRPLGDKPTCYRAAADLLAAYRHAHWGSLQPFQLQNNYGHEGEMRAASGDYAHAVGLIMSSLGENGDSGQDDYVLGTVAFLKRDLPALKSARERLARTPPPEGFEIGRAKFKAKFHRDLVWPLNLDVLDGLISCFDKPYDQAYGGCRSTKTSDKSPGASPSGK
jgi:hypothetical protein